MVSIARAFLLAAAVLAVGCSGGRSLGTTSLTPQSPSQGRSAQSLEAFPISASAFPISASAFPICAQQPDIESVQCHVEQRSDLVANPDPNAPLAAIDGYFPNDLQQIYKIDDQSETKGAAQTIAIVTAWDNDDLESDLNVYRNRFGLGPCTVSGGCLTISAGHNVKPPKDHNWSIEADLDVEMASAICPNCNLLVVEAKSSKIQDLADAVDTAAASGATVISNSWSLPESPGAFKYESHFNHPGIPVTTGAGDGGFGVGFPAASTYVTAVGGTTVKIYEHTKQGDVVVPHYPMKNDKPAAATVDVSVWSNTGSGCSAYASKPKWQKDKGCAMRTSNDLGIVGDPATGVAAFSTGAGGWVVLGGTSIGAPVTAALYILGGHTSEVNDASRLYNHPGSFTDVLTGSNGTCSPAYLCNGSKDYDAPAGLGSPKDLAAF